MLRKFSKNVKNLNNVASINNVKNVYYVYYIYGLEFNLIVDDGLWRSRCGDDGKGKHPPIRRFTTFLASHRYLATFRRRDRTCAVLSFMVDA